MDLLQVAIVFSIFVVLKLVPITNDAALIDWKTLYFLLIAIPLIEYYWDKGTGPPYRIAQKNSITVIMFIVAIFLFEVLQLFRHWQFRVTFIISILVVCFFWWRWIADHPIKSR
jgi:hypothetical protein